MQESESKMSSLIVNEKSYNVSLKPVGEGQERAVMDAAKKNGADDVLLKVGNDTFLASGRGLPIGRVKNTVTLDGREGRVLDKNAELNTFGEGMRQRLGLWFAAPMVLIGSLVELSPGLGGGMTLRGAGLMFGIIPGLLLGLVSNVPSALRGAFRKIEA
jgi:hypothetical protein